MKKKASREADKNPTPLTSGKHPALGGDLPTHARYQQMVRDLLRGYISRQHPDYKFFHTLMTGVIEAAEKQNRTMRGLGDRLLQLTANDAVTPTALAELRKHGTSLKQSYVSPNLKAIQGISVAMRLVEVRDARQKSNSNLRPRQKLVSDQQISAVLEGAMTRAEQAERLGITERTLYRRLKKTKR